MGQRVSDREPTAPWVRRAGSEADTQALAAEFAVALPAGLPRALRVYLTGDLGAGKTTFVRGFLRQLGVVGPVRSPTYSLLEQYEPHGIRVLHVDLYRLAVPEDVAALGFGDFDLPGSVWLIEWPERGAGALPAPDLTLRLTAGPLEHWLEASPGSPAGERWLQRLSQPDAA